MFGIYISNFYEPFSTNLYEKKPIEDAVAKLMGGNIPASAKTFSDTLAESVLANIMENSRPLVNSSGETVSLFDFTNADSAQNYSYVDNSGSSHTVYSLNHKHDTVYIAPNTSNNAADIGSFMFGACLVAGGFGLKDSSNVEKVFADFIDSPVKVSPFGDIFVADGK